MRTRRAFFSTSLVSFLCFCHSASALWPIPRSLETGATLLKLSPQFDIQVHGIPRGLIPHDLLDAVSRTKSRLATDRLQRLVVGRGEDDFERLITAPSLVGLSLSLTSNSSAIKSIMEEATKDIETRSEEYSLTIPATHRGIASLTASSSLGLLRGLTTFEQLWYKLSDEIYTYQAPVKITNDFPAYPYRGFMLDTSRNFFPVADIKRTLDAMSMIKMSQFHWHVVDAQSFPLFVPEFPELSQMGAYSAREVYSPADVQDIVTYAGVRGIDVLMEIDTPGHTAAISLSHPAHVACAHALPWQTYAVEPPAGQLRIASAATANFTASLLTSIAETLPSKLFGTGGDELQPDCYRDDVQTQRDLALTNRTLDQALDDFMQTTHRALEKIGKTRVVWQEMVLSEKVTLPKNTIVMVWLSSENAAEVTAKGFRVVHAPSNYFYLDCGGGPWFGTATKLMSWCDPYKSWQKAYTFDPLANLTAEEIPLVLGGQHILWTEQSSPFNLDNIVWPRAAVAAEIFWTGAKLPNGEPLDVTTALHRLHDIRYRMTHRGIKAIALQPHWCALRDGFCEEDT